MGRKKLVVQVAEPRAAQRASVPPSKIINALCRLQSATGVVAAHDALDGQQLADEVSTAPYCKQHSAA